MLINIDPKALEHACQCAGRSVHHFDRMGDELPLRASIIAHARAIEQHEAFRQEVSDAVEKHLCTTASSIQIADVTRENLARFIIAKPDPLVEALHHSGFSQLDIGRVEAALAARGLEIREKQSMTDEAKALIERLRDDLPQTLIEKHWVDDNDAIYKQREEAADLIETQAREIERLTLTVRKLQGNQAALESEIERLRAVLDNIAHESSDTWARRDACVALGIDWPETRRQP